VTHVFHPLCGRELALVDQYLAWGEDRVCFHDDKGELRYLPTAWTSLASPDPFAQASAGRSHFRIEDPRSLPDNGRRGGPDRDGGHVRCKPNCVRHVKTIMSATLPPTRRLSPGRAPWGGKLRASDADNLWSISANVSVRAQKAA
jgi:hypothetical protein